MSLIPWQNKRRRESREPAPADVFGRFHEEMDRMLGRFFQDTWSGGEHLLPTSSPAEAGAWMPALDLTENDKEVLVRAELPGVDPKNIDIDLSGDLLTISGKKEEESEREEGTWRYRESRFGSFRRSISLPSAVASEGVVAEYEKGVLRVRLPKERAKEAKKISVGVSSV